jgi:hypothetical protein
VPRGREAFGGLVLLSATITLLTSSGRLERECRTVGYVTAIGEWKWSYRAFWLPNNGVSKLSGVGWSGRSACGVAMLRRGKQSGQGSHEASVVGDPASKARRGAGGHCLGRTRTAVFCWASPLLGSGSGRIDRFGSPITV